MGNGDGTFQPGIVTDTAAFAEMAEAADFNKDGKLDVAVIDGNGLEIFLGKGNGTFQPPITYLDMGGSFTSLAIGDLNNDGNLDIVTGGEIYLGVFLGNGNGTFQPEVTYTISSQGQKGVALADLNGDGKLDVITNEAAVLFGNGDGTLQPPTVYAPGNTPFGVATADFNGDGHPDVAIALDTSVNTLPGAASILINNGDGTLKASVVTLANIAFAGSPLVGGDFNHDGKFDFAALLAVDGSAGVYLGNGDGTFQPPLLTGGLAFPTSMASADFNGDGNIDLAVGEEEIDKVVVLLGNADGTLQPPVFYRLAGPSLQEATGDFNGDGKPDIAALVVSGKVQEVSLLINTGNGTFVAGSNTPVGENAAAIVAGDFNGDGKLDLAVANVRASNIEVFLGNGDGTFQAGVDYPIPTGLPINPTLEAADMNHDGKLDLVVHCIAPNGILLPIDSVDILLGNGDGTFQAPVYNLYIGANFAISDFNGDDNLDVAGAGGDLLVGLGTGGVNLQGSIEYITGATAALAGDLNGDGAPDLVLTTPTGYTALLNVGGTFDTLTSSPNPSDYRQLVTFTDTVTASVSGAPGGVPTGTVTFKDGTNTIAIVTLQNGEANLTTSRLTLGAHSITAAYSDNASFNPKVSAPLTQTVIGPMAELSPSKLNFGKVKVGGNSQPQTATLTNSGTAPLDIKSIAISSDFIQTNNCPGSLAPTATCTISVIFTPTRDGALQGDVSFTDNAPDSPQKILMKGMGVQ